MTTHDRQPSLAEGFASRLAQSPVPMTRPCGLSDCVARTSPFSSQRACSRYSVKPAGALLSPGENDPDAQSGWIEKEGLIRVESVDGRTRNVVLTERGKDRLELAYLSGIKLSNTSGKDLESKDGRSHDGLARLAETAEENR